MATKDVPTAKSGVKPSRTSMIDSLLRSDGGLSRAILRGLPLSKLRLLYNKLISTLPNVPEFTAKIDTAGIDTNSDEYKSTLRATIPATRTSDKNDTELPLTAPIDSKHVSNNGVYVNLNRILERYLSFTDPVQADEY